MRQKSNGYTYPWRRKLLCHHRNQTCNLCIHLQWSSAAGQDCPAMCPCIPTSNTLHHLPVYTFQTLSDINSHRLLLPYDLHIHTHLLNAQMFHIVHSRWKHGSGEPSGSVAQRTQMSISSMIIVLHLPLITTVPATFYTCIHSPSIPPLKRRRSTQHYKCCFLPLIQRLHIRYIRSTKHCNRLPDLVLFKLI